MRRAAWCKQPLFLFTFHLCRAQTHRIKILREGSTRSIRRDAMRSGCLGYRCSYFEWLSKQRNAFAVWTCLALNIHRQCVSLLAAEIQLLFFFIHSYPFWNVNIDAYPYPRNAKWTDKQKISIAILSLATNCAYALILFCWHYTFQMHIFFYCFLSLSSHTWISNCVFFLHFV